MMSLIATKDWAFQFRSYAGFILALSFLAVSCTPKSAPEDHFTFGGSASEYLLQNDVRALNDQAASYELNLFCQVDSLCLPEFYYEPLAAFDSTIVIQAYLNPRLIKASVSGLGHLMLDGGSFGREYFKIQNEYAEGGSLGVAMLKMADLCESAFDESRSKTNWFRRHFQDGSIRETLDESMQAALQYVVPGRKLCTTLVKPIYAMGYWSIKMAGTTTRGLLLMITLFAFVILLLYFIPFKIKSFGLRLSVAIVENVLLCFMFIFVAYYTFIVGKPWQENLFAFKNVYHYRDLLPLQSAYSVFSFRASSFVLVLLTTLAFYAVRLLILKAKFKLAEFFGTVEETIKQVSDDFTEKTSSDPLGWLKNLLLPFAIFLFIDKSLVLGFFVYFVLKIITLAHLIKPVGRFYSHNANKIILGLVVVAICVVSLLTAPRIFAKNNDTRYPKNHLDSASYYYGESLGQYMIDHGIVDYRATVDSMQVYDGFKEYMDCRSYRSNKRLNVRKFADLQVLLKNLSENPVERAMNSYQLGATVARNLYNNGASAEIKPNLVIRGMSDVLMNKPSRYPNAKFNDVISLHKRINDLHQEGDCKKVASRFLADNAQNEGVVYLPSGLQYKIVKEGSIKKATPESVVGLRYYYYTLGGDIIYSMPASNSYKLGKLHPGICEAVCQIGEGGEVIAWIPSHLFSDSKTKPGKPGELIVYDISLQRVYH